MITYKQFVILCQRHSAREILKYLESHVLRIRLQHSTILESDNIYHNFIMTNLMSNIQSLTYADILPFIATEKDKRKMLWIHRYYK